MKSNCLLVALLIVKTNSNDVTTSRYNTVRRFPDGFLFGAASSAYQVEGAWNIDGKGESIIDRLVHTKLCYATDCSTGDVAANSYFLYRRDVEIMRELGLDFYRFSLSWTRILPTGFPNKINKAGVNYYNNLINEMLQYNIQPVVTLFHWDLPQKLQDLGGVTNPYFIDWFGDYARVAFELFGDRVKYWITVNEPYQFCNGGYEEVQLAPAIESKGIGIYMCSRNILLAHARAFHIYDEIYRPKYRGIIFIALNAHWFEPASHSDSDVEAADDLFQFFFGQFAQPIFSQSGDYPEVMKKRIAAKSAKQGFFRSRLLEFTTEEVKYLQGTSDILGLNHYMTSYAYRNATDVGNTNEISFEDDHSVLTFQPEEWIIGDTNVSMLVPRGFYKLLTRIRLDYNPVIFITENGYPSRGRLIDNDRILFYNQYLNAVLDAIDDGTKVVAYTAWSLIDNFEWFSGYSVRLGLYEVDFNSSWRIRTPRRSAYWYKKVTRHEARKFPGGFKFGAATSSYQVEGAWNVDGKSEHIWDRLLHKQPCIINNCENGDVAANSYYNYKRDVEMMRELGLDYYRFSVSWPRILPSSFPDHINEAGLNYYNNLINEMLKYDIQPMVTIYHWDLPQKLQDLGGWTNPHMIDWFTDYARVVFQAFGDRVKHWLTINEPREICYFGYAAARMAPMYNITGFAEYLCAKNVLLAHANVYHLYDKEFRQKQGGTIGIVLSMFWQEPETEKDAEAAF